MKGVKEIHYFGRYGLILIFSSYIACHFHGLIFNILGTDLLYMCLDLPLLTLYFKKVPDRIHIVEEILQAAAYSKNINYCMAPNFPSIKKFR